MANIVTDVAGIKNVRMTNARFARAPLTGVFTGWTKLRVALFVQWLDSGANITGTPRFAAGLCAGSTNIMGDATTTHFAGIITTGASWTRTAGPPTRYGGGSITTNPAKKVGATLTTGTAFGTLPTVHTSAPFMLFVDFTFGSPNYTIQPFYYTSTAAPVPTEADFLTQSVAGVPVFTNHSLVASQVVAVDEATDGVFDHACVWWDQTTPSMDILAWRIYRLS